VGYLDSIGCVPVGFRGSHHCFTDNGNQGIFHCCPPGVLDEQMRRAAEGSPDGEEEQENFLQTGLFFGLSAFALAALGAVAYADWKDKQRERKALRVFEEDYR